MDPRVYVPAYLERLYIQEHPGLTAGARALVREQIAAEPERYAANAHARALLAYSRVHGELADALFRMEGLPDDEFERDRGELFSRARGQLARIIAEDATCLDARLVSIQLSEVPLDACLSDMLKLEREAREALIATRPGFDPDVDGLWRPGTLPRDASGVELSAAELTASDPDLIGWLHILEALAQGSIFTARYRSAANYARTVMRAQGFPNYAVGTLLLALARLEDEDAFFRAVREAGPDVEELPWFGLGRTLLLYKLGQTRSARRALRDFAARCEGGAFFLLNPTYHDPYLPVRPPALEAWDLAHQAVWEADGIIADTPDFTLWAEGVDGVRAAADDFARRYGF